MKVIIERNYKLRYRYTSEEQIELLNYFCDEIEPWCRENNYSLHEAFLDSRQNQPQYYSVLSKLWHTYSGKAYLQSLFKSSGGRLRRK